MLPVRNVTNVVTILLIVFISGTANQAASTRTDDLSGVINLTKIPGPYSFERFCKLKTNELWAVGGNGTVQFSSAMGMVERHITDEDLNGVYFTNSSVGWVVGDEGSIWHTADQGHGWSRQTSGVKQSLQGIKCTTDSRCWAVGERGVVLRTDDAGEHWDNKRSEASVNLFAVDFVDDQIGWAAGENGLLLHTANGGESWETQHAIITLFPEGPFATPTNLLTVKFVNHEVGWVAGTGGIARTIDGGKTWQAKQIEDSSFIGLVSNDPETAWAIGRDGTNYVTRNSGRTWEPTMEKTVAKQQPKKLSQLSSMAIQRRRVRY